MKNKWREAHRVDHKLNHIKWDDERLDTRSYMYSIKERLLKFNDVSDDDKCLHRSTEKWFNPFLSGEREKENLKKLIDILCYFGTRVDASVWYQRFKIFLSLKNFIVVLLRSNKFDNISKHSRFPHFQTKQFKLLFIFH